MFKNKIALVTWWTSWIGLETVYQLLINWAKIIYVYSKSSENVEKLNKKVEKYIDNVIWFKVNVTNENDVQNMFEEVKNKYWYIDYLVNNAGIDIPQALENFNYNDWKRIIDVNLNWKFLCLKYAIPLLKKSLNPRVVNVASRLSRKPLEEAWAYCCSEAWVDMLTKVSALELSKYNIKVNTVSPWFTRTPLTESIYSNENEWNIAWQNNPSKRVWKPIDIANAIIFLLSENADYINWANIDVNWWSMLK